MNGEIKQLRKILRLPARFVLGNFRRKASVTEMLKTLGWKSLESRRKKARLKCIFKAYTGDPAWRDLTKRLKVPSYLTRKDHNYKIKPLNSCQIDKNFHSYIGDRGLEWLAGGNVCFALPNLRQNIYDQAK